MPKTTQRERDRRRGNIYALLESVGLRERARGIEIGYREGKTAGFIEGWEQRGEAKAERGEE